MNLFGTSTSDGAGRLVRNIAVGGGILALCAVAAAGFLDQAAQDGTLASIRFQHAPGDPARSMAQIPRPAAPVGGVRYGQIDYMPTASIPGSGPRVKNVVSDPSLGMPN